MSSDLLTRPAVEWVALLSAGKISPIELAEEHIRQVERLNPSLNALVDFSPDRIRMQARELAPDRRGPLYGLPMTIKSSIATAGMRCEVGSLLKQGFIPDEDAEVVARVRRSGATILGTTNCPEFLMAYESANLLHGRTANPWNLDYSSGGSSGGEAAAIAAGLSAGGLGSDSGGSVRQPAHAVGICALKPTPGRIPGRGHIPPCVGPFSILGAIGPMARTVADLSLFFRVLSGQDNLDPISPPLAERVPSLEELRSMPIGYFEDDGLIPVTADTRAALQRVVASLERRNFNLRPFRPRALELARKLWWTFFMRCGVMFYQPMIQGQHERLSPVFREYLAFTGDLPPLQGGELLEAWAECDVIRGKLLQEMREYPILLCPVSAVPAFRHGERSWQIDGRQVDYLDAMRFTQWFNLLGAPAASVPVGFSAEGLPIGIQVAGRPYEDEVVLAVAAEIERDFGYIAPPLSR